MNPSILDVIEAEQVTFDISVKVREQLKNSKKTFDESQSLRHENIRLLNSLSLLETRLYQASTVKEVTEIKAKMKMLRSNISDNNSKIKEKMDGYTY